MAIIKKPSQFILRVSVGIVFLSAGLYRIFYPGFARQEILDLGLPVFITWVIVALEIASGLLLLAGKYLRLVSLVMIIFLALALTQGLMANGANVFENFGDLFVFRANPVDMFLHLMFIVVLIVLWIENGKKINP
jgi:uncharacterized membrane protein YphA (DoxX/SURF4 family)